MNYLFTSESVSEGHPDKVADQISDAILDEFLRQDKEAKVACETFCTAGLVVVGGEVRSDDAYVDVPAVVRRTIMLNMASMPHLVVSFPRFTSRVRISTGEWYASGRKSRAPEIRV